MSNLSSLRIDISETTVATASQGGGRTACRRIIGGFLRGPVALDWLQKAAKLPGRAMHVGVALWYLDGFQRAGTVRLKPSVLRNFGVNRHASYRALNELEAAGLVSVVHKRGAAPMVTLLS